MRKNRVFGMCVAISLALAVILAACTMEDSREEQGRGPVLEQPGMGHGSMIGGSDDRWQGDRGYEGCDDIHEVECGGGERSWEGGGSSAGGGNGGGGSDDDDWHGAGGGGSGGMSGGSGDPRLFPERLFEEEE